MRNYKPNHPLMSFLAKHSLLLNCLEITTEDQFYFNNKILQLYRSIGKNTSLKNLDIGELDSDLLSIRRLQGEDSKSFNSRLLISFDKDFIKGISCYSANFNREISPIDLDQVQYNLPYKIHSYIVGKEIAKQFISNPLLKRNSLLNTTLDYYPILTYNHCKIYSDIFSMKENLIDPNKIYFLPKPENLGRAKYKLISSYTDKSNNSIEYHIQTKKFILTPKK